MNIVLVACVFVLGIIRTTECAEEMTDNDLLLDNLLIQWVPSNYAPSNRLVHVQDLGAQEFMIALEQRQMAFYNYLRHFMRSAEVYREDEGAWVIPGFPNSAFNPSVSLPDLDSPDKSKKVPSNCVPVAYDCGYPIPNQKESTDFKPLYPGLYPTQNNPKDEDDDKGKLTDDEVLGVLDILGTSNQSDEDSSETYGCKTDCEALNPQRSDSQETSELESFIGQIMSIKDYTEDEEYRTYIKCLVGKVSCLHKEINREASSKSCEDSTKSGESENTSEDDSVESKIFGKHYLSGVTKDLLRGLRRKSRANYNDNNSIGYHKSIGKKEKVFNCMANFTFPDTANLNNASYV